MTQANDTTYVTQSQPDIDAPWLNDVNAAALRANSSMSGVVAAMYRTAIDKFSERVSVLDYGAVGDGVTDDTTAIAAAIIGAAGGVLYFPGGSYKVSSALTINSALTVYGDYHNTLITTTSATANIFTVTSPYVRIIGLNLDSSATRSAGWYIDINDTSYVQCSVTDCEMRNWIGGIRVKGTSSTIESCKLYNGIATTGVAIRVDGGFDITVRDVVSDSAADIYAGIYVTEVGDLTIQDCNLIHCGQALYLNPQAGQTVASVWAINTFFDTSIRGLNITPDGAAAAVVRCSFTQCWFSSHSLQGAYLAVLNGATVSGVYFNACQFYLNTGDGLAVASTGVEDVHVRGGAAAGQAAATGISFAADVSEFSVIGAKIGAGDGIVANLYGISVAVGTGGNYTIADNILRSNTTSPLVDGGTGTGKCIHHNPDYDTGSATYNPPDLAAGATATTTVSVFGASLGDIVHVSFSVALAGLTMTAWVSAAGTVSVHFFNGTAGNINLASGTLLARIERFT
jgi:hypothetical protein